MNDQYRHPIAFAIPSFFLVFDLQLVTSRFWFATGHYPKFYSLRSVRRKQDFQHANIDSDYKILRFSIKHFECLLPKDGHSFDLF